jgi:condensin complex subunit 2
VARMSLFTVIFVPGGDESSIPFNTQFFHDDDDDGPGFDDGFDGDLAGTADPGEQDLLAGTQGKTRRVRPEFVNYTKRAKRVDVRKLKENIWKGLKIPTPEGDAMVRETRGIRMRVV